MRAVEHREQAEFGRGPESRLATPVPGWPGGQGRFDKAIEILIGGPDHLVKPERGLVLAATRRVSNRRNAEGPAWERTS